MGVSNESVKGSKIPAWLGPALVYAVSIACLIWVYRDFNWHEQLPRLKRIHPAWILLSVTADILVYVVQAWRWNLLLTPVADVPLGRSVQAVYIGMLANELLPLRSGEVIRCYLQSQWSKISFPVAVSSALIERLLDGVWLILGFFITTLFIRVDANLKAGAGALAVVVAALGILLAYAVHRRDTADDSLTKYRWLSVLRHLVEGLHAMARSRSFLLAAGASLLYLAMQVIPIFAISHGYGVDLSIGHATCVLVILRLGTVIPGLPGNIGLFNAFAVAALRLVGVDRQTAKGLSGVMFFVITVPLVIAGCISVALTGLKLRDLHKSAHSQLSMGREKEPEKISS